MYFNSRGLFTLHLCYIYLKFCEISHFIKNKNFFLTANNFFLPPNKIDIYYVYQKGIWVSQNKLFWQTSKETMGVWGGDFLWFKYIVMLYFCRAKKGGTKYYGLSLFAQKLLRFILFYLKNARANNVLV